MSEAMASGLPIVATDVGGNYELVDQNRTGFLVPRGEPVALADAVRVYLDNPDLRRLHGSMLASAVKMNSVSIPWYSATRMFMMSCWIPACNYPR